jgi:hypothetical protein
MRILFDMVLNHVGYEAPLTRTKPQWFHRRGTIEDWDDREDLLNGDVHGLPDLDQENPEVYRYLLDASLHWLREASPDGFRLDAVRHVPMGFWERYSHDLRASQPSVILAGELFEGHAGRLARAFSGAGFTHVFDFPLYYAMIDYFCRGAPPGRLASVLFEDRRYEDPSHLITFLDNHDLPRILTACAEEPSRVRRALSFLLLTRGVPAITYGTESGLTGEGEPENRGDMRFMDSAGLGGDLKRLLALRRSHPVLARGRTILLEANEILVCLRLLGDHAALVVDNPGTETRDIDLGHDLGSGVRGVRAFDAARSGPSFAIPPGTSVWFIHGRSGLELDTEADVREIRFFWPNDLPSDGETLLVVGSGPELGDWDPADGVVLTPQDGASGLISATVALPVRGSFAYKFAWRDAEGRIFWTPRADAYRFVRPER